MAQELTWTVSVKTNTGQRLIGTYATKREAVTELMARRQPKTPIGKFGRDYVYVEPT